MTVDCEERLEIVTTIERTEEIAGAWADLWQDAQALVFQNHAWVMGWWKETEPARRTLRRFRQPVFAQVTVEEGRPVHVSPQGLPGGPVMQAAGPWRTSGDWWKTRENTWDRDEWDVSLGDGAVYRIFQDRARGDWFVDAIVD